MEEKVKHASRLGQLFLVLVHKYHQHQGLLHREVQVFSLSPLAVAAGAGCRRHCLSPRWVLIKLRLGASITQSNLNPQGLSVFSWPVLCLQQQNCFSLSSTQNQRQSCLGLSSKWNQQQVYFLLVILQQPKISFRPFLNSKSATKLLVPVLSTIISD